MTAKEVQELEIGDRVQWAGSLYTVIDWQCYKEPIFHTDGTKIYAGPVLKENKANKWNQPRHIHSAFWHELERIGE